MQQTHGRGFSARVRAAERWRSRQEANGEPADLGSYNLWVRNKQRCTEATRNAVWLAMGRGEKALAPGSVQVAADGRLVFL